MGHPTITFKDKSVLAYPVFFLRHERASSLQKVILQTPESSNVLSKAALLKNTYVRMVTDMFLTAAPHTDSNDSLLMRIEDLERVRLLRPHNANCHEAQGIEGLEDRA